MRVLFALFALVASVATVSAQSWTGPNFYITKGDGTDYYFSINGSDVKDPSLNFIVGTTYKFVLNASMPSHPFGFSVSNATATPGSVPTEDFSSSDKGGVTVSGACTPNTANTTWYTSDVANPCIVSITPPADAATKPAIYYRCSIHPNMVGALTAVSAAGSSTGTTTAPPSSNNTTGSSTGGSSTGTTTAPPSGNSTTPPPTTPAPSSTGKSGAAVLVPGAAVLLIAAVNALFSA